MQRIPIRLRLAALAVLLALGAQSLAQAVESPRQYTVKPGDTLGAISLGLGVPVPRLLALNNLTDANALVAGQMLALPDDAAAAVAPGPPNRGGRDYTVRSGDSLSRIAAELGVSTAAIVQANSLVDPDRLVAGQQLTIPGGQPPSGPSPADRAVAGPDPGRPAGALLDDAAARYKLDAALVKALAWYLSAWRADATGPGGAVGLMQVTSTAQDWAGPALLKRPVDRTDPRDNVDIGVAYLAYLVNKLGEERQGVAAYLQGPAGLARGGPSPTTSRALDAIYASRARFSGGGPASPASPPAAAAARDLAPVVLAAARGVSTAARVGVAARNLATGERIDVRSGEIFHSASVNKVPILVETMREIGSGKLSRAAVGADLERMIVQSDNDAANRLLDLVGEPSVNGTMSKLGLGSTVLHNHFSDSRGPSDPGFNQTSPADMAGLFRLLATDQLIGAASSQEMRELLTRTQDSSKLVRGLPPGTRVAHKSGWFTGVANDVGIVYAPRATYVLAVFSDGVADGETGDRLIAAVSRAVYDAWGK